MFTVGIWKTAILDFDYDGLRNNMPCGNERLAI